MMTFRQQLRRWWLGLVRGTVQGGAVAVKSFATLACANAAGAPVPMLDLNQTFSIFVAGAAYHFFDYLATTPIPEVKP